MKNVMITFVDGTITTYENVTKVWLENSTKRYILHRKDDVGTEHHTFINRENVLIFDVLDPDGWKYKKRDKDEHRGRHEGQKPYYTSEDREEDEDYEYEE